MRGWGERELVYTVRAKEFLTVPKEQPTRLSRRMGTLSVPSLGLMAFSLLLL